MWIHISALGEIKLARQVASLTEWQDPWLYIAKSENRKTVIKVTLLHAMGMEYNVIRNTNDINSYKAKSK